MEENRYFNSLLSCDVKKQTGTITELTAEKEELISTRNAVNLDLQNALRQVEHLHVELCEKENEIEKSEKINRTMVQHLEDTGIVGKI